MQYNDHKNSGPREVANNINRSIINDNLVKGEVEADTEITFRRTGEQILQELEKIAHFKSKQVDLIKAKLNSMEGVLTIVPTVESGLGYNKFNEELLIIPIDSAPNTVCNKDNEQAIIKGGSVEKVETYRAWNNTVAELEIISKGLSITTNMLSGIKPEQVYNLSAETIKLFNL